MRRREFITFLGTAAACPLSAPAQQPTMSVIGFLHQASQRALDRERGRARVAGRSGRRRTARRLIVQLVEELQLPAVYPFRDFVDIGGLMAYAVDLAELFHHAARQVGQILKGANPAEIPFFQATKFQVLINLKTAKSLGITIPPSVLARADEVIE